MLITESYRSWINFLVWCFQRGGCLLWFSSVWRCEMWMEWTDGGMVNGKSQDAGQPEEWKVTGRKKRGRKSKTWSEISASRTVRTLQNSEPNHWREKQKEQDVSQNTKGKKSDEHRYPKSLFRKTVSRFSGLHLQKYFGKLARSVITLHFHMTFTHLTSK